MRKMLLAALVCCVAHMANASEATPDKICNSTIDDKTTMTEFVKSLHGCEGKIIGVNISDDASSKYEQAVAMKVCDYHSTILVTHDPVMKSAMISCIKR